MKPMITIKLFDDSNDEIAKLNTIKVTEIWKLLKEVDFSTGTIRVDYFDKMYNEANFLNASQAKLLLSIFKDKSLLNYIYEGGF